jgi:hypothetical protein
MVARGLESNLLINSEPVQKCVEYHDTTKQRHLVQAFARLYTSVGLDTEELWLSYVRRSGAEIRLLLSLWA